MRVVVDTNVILRATQLADPQHQTARSGLARLVGAGHELCLVPQILYEYWVVATRPISVNGLGLATAEAATKLAGLKASFRILRDERGLLEIWERVVTSLGVQGKSAHDARLVAAMQRHGIERLCTFDTADFARYPGIVAAAPS